MKVYWDNQGLHVYPEDQNERSQLLECLIFLNGVDFQVMERGESAPISSINSSNEKLVSTSD